MEKDLKLVLIEWEDSRQPMPQWQRLKDFKVPERCLCVSVGYLVYDGEDTKVLAPNLADRDKTLQGSGLICIPARAVIRAALLACAG